MALTRIRPNNIWTKIGRPSKLLSIRLALVLFFGEILAGTFVYVWLEEYSLLEGFYMSIITISTVGFTEVSPLSAAGRTFTSFFILVNIGIFAYLIAVFSYYIIEGQIFHYMHEKGIRDEIGQLQQHVILCGYGRYGNEIVANLRHTKQELVIIEKDPERIESLAKDNARLLYVEGDATQDEVLQEAGIERAKAVISALSDDSDNVFIALSARQLNPGIKIISRAVQPRSQRKLKLAGANHIIKPEQLGGFYMATLVNKPGAVEFFGFIANEYQADVGFEEIKYEDLPVEYRGKEIRHIHLRRDTGVNIIGHRDINGFYQINPGPDTVLNNGESFIVLGNEEQIARLRQFLGK